MPQNVTAADHGGSVPAVSVSCPSDKDPAMAAHIRVSTATHLANDAYRATQITNLGNDKVAKAGDTMSDTLDIDATTSNANALEATGNGTGEGAVITGGATGRGASIQAGGGNNIGAYCAGAGTGPGVSALGGATGRGGEFLAGGGNTAGLLATGTGTGPGGILTGGPTGNGATCAAGGSGNGHGVVATATGTGSGIVATGGATGPGITASPGTASSAAVPQCAGKFAGYIEITADDPAAGVIPPDAHVFYGLSGCKAYVTVEVDGASGPYSKDDEHNVGVVDDVATGVYSVDFGRDMASAAYTVSWGCDVLGVGVAIHNKTAGGFQFTTYDTNTKAAVAVTAVVDLQVFGRR
jgi:hypothetical protein